MIHVLLPGLLLLVAAAPAETAKWLAAGQGPAAGVLLGTTPTQVHRPATPSTATATLTNLSLTTTSSWALEVAPYWVLPHPRLSFDTYQAARGLRAGLHSLSLSLATVPATTDTPFEMALAGNTLLRWGDRATRDTRMESCLAALRLATRDKATWIDEALREAPAATAEELEKKLAELLAAYDKEHAEAKSKAEKSQIECRRILEERRGFAVDGGGGVAVGVPDMNATETRLSRWGVWLTPAWLAERWSVSGVVGAFQSLLDEEDPDPNGRLGVQLIHAWDRVALSGEGLWEIHPSAADVHQGRTALGVDLQLTQGFWFTSTLALSLPADADGSLSSLFGLTWGTGAVRSLAPLPEPAVPDAKATR